MIIDKIKKMDKEKFTQRVEEMIYYICGCNFDEAEIILKECLIRNEKRTIKSFNLIIIGIFIISYQ